MTGSHAWHILTYRVPGQPTQLRAAVGRRLKTAGAVYLANSVAALPASPATERLLRHLRAEITTVGGSAQLLLAQAVAGEAGVIRLFSAARDEEYGQFITACQDLQHDIGSSAAAGRRSIAGLDRADRQFARLARRHTEVTAKDPFGAAQAHAAGVALARLQDALDSLAASVRA